MPKDTSHPFTSSTSIFRTVAVSPEATSFTQTRVSTLRGACMMAPLPRYTLARITLSDVREARQKQLELATPAAPVTPLRPTEPRFSLWKRNTKSNLEYVAAPFPIMEGEEDWFPSRTLSEERPVHRRLERQGKLDDLPDARRTELALAKTILSQWPMPKQRGQPRRGKFRMQVLDGVPEGCVLVCSLDGTGAKVLSKMHPMALLAKEAVEIRCKSQLTWFPGHYAWRNENNREIHMRIELPTVADVLEEFEITPEVQRGLSCKGGTILMLLPDGPSGCESRLCEDDWITAAVIDCMHTTKVKDMFDLVGPCDFIFRDPKTGQNNVNPKGYRFSTIRGGIDWTTSTS
ncbi:hypothetical protein FRB94_013180 [Tulasnella sp. JGI-2019a]|nr:hypothetical protein FRB94_013180 [Tulasnella sp. JGI-2019a]